MNHPSSGNAGLSIAQTVLGTFTKGTGRSIHCSIPHNNPVQQKYQSSVSSSYGASSAHKSPVPHRLSNPQSPNHIHHHHHHVYYFLSPGQQYHHAPSRSSLLPFLGGAFLGVLGLSTWQHTQVSADCRFSAGINPNVSTTDQMAAAQPHLSAMAHHRHQNSPPASPCMSTAVHDLLLSRQQQQQQHVSAWSSQVQTEVQQQQQCDDDEGELHMQERIAALYGHMQSQQQQQVKEDQQSLQLQNTSWFWGSSRSGERKCGDMNPHTFPSGASPPRSRPISSLEAPQQAAGVTLDMVITQDGAGGCSSVCCSDDRPPLVSFVQACSNTAHEGSDVSTSASASESVHSYASSASSSSSTVTSTKVDPNQGTSTVVDRSQQPLLRGSISAASAAAGPAVVHIVVGDGQGTATPGSSYIHPDARYRTSSGSGFIYDSRGYILTNSHVVESAWHDSSSRSSNRSSSQRGQHHDDSSSNRTLTITMHDGRVCKGRVIAMDKLSDVAIVKADVTPDQQLPAASIGRSVDLRAGEWVLALGTPLMLKHSVTAGIVSCVERRGSELGLPGVTTAFIQTDAAINQGNSGGPLVDLDGRVVGMNVFKAVAADGVSFAIPIETVVEVVRQLHDHGRVVRPYVGVTLVEVSNGALTTLQQQVPQLSRTRAAVIIQAVKQGSPAQEAGFQPGDIIIDLDGRQGMKMSEVVEAFGRGVGKTIACTVVRRKTIRGGAGGSSGSSGGAGVASSAGNVDGETKHSTGGEQHGVASMVHALKLVPREAD